MPAPTASPAFAFSADGVTYGAVGAPITVDAGAAVWAKIDNIANVNQVAWIVLNTDDLTTPGSYTLTPSGPKGSIVKIAAMGSDGTGLILQSTINAGVNPATGNVDPTMSATGIADVLAGNGKHVCVYNEQNESGPQGWAAKVNAAIRGAGGGGGGDDTLLLTLGSSGPGAGGGPAGSRVVLPSSDFPGATTATLEATICASAGTGAPAWVADTVYSSTSSPPSIVQANGTVWICTTGGTSAVSGSGPNAEGPTVHDGSCIWRSAQAVFTAYLFTSTGQTVIATFSIGYQFGASLSNGAATMNFTADVTSALIPLGSAGVVVCGIAGDPADPSNFTAGQCFYAAVKFS